MLRGLLRRKQVLRLRSSAAAAHRARLQKDLRSTASSSSASYAGVTAANTVEVWDDRGYPSRGVDRTGRPYGAGAHAVGRGEVTAESVVDQQCGQFASLVCSAQFCCDQLGMAVQGGHDKCTGRALDSTAEAPIFELYVVSCGKVLTVAADSVDNRIGPLQVQWIHDSSVAHAQSVCAWDGCDAAGTRWDQLTPLGQGVQYQQRAMPVVGVPVGVGVGPGEGITGVPMPRSPGASVQWWNSRVAAQPPPSVGSSSSSAAAAGTGEGR